MLLMCKIKRLFPRGNLAPSQLRLMKICLAFLALFLLFVQNFAIQFGALVVLLPFAIKQWRDAKMLRFWLIFAAFSFWPCIFIRSMQTVEISAVAVCRAINFYLILRLITENINLTKMDYYLPKILGHRVSAAVILAFNLSSNLNRTTIRNYYLFRLKQKSQCASRVRLLKGFILALFRQVMGVADNCAENMILAHRLKHRPRVVIITGAKHSGKTTYATALVAQFKARKFPVSGILAPSEMQDGRRTSIWVESIKTGAALFLASRTRLVVDKVYEYGGFTFSQAGYDFARKELLNFAPRDLVFLDEFGVLEFAGLGYVHECQQLFDANIAALFIVIRKELVERFVTAYKLDNYEIIDIQSKNAFAREKFLLIEKEVYSDNNAN